MKNYLFTLLLSLAIPFSFISCNDDDSSNDLPMDAYIIGHWEYVEMEIDVDPSILQATIEAYTKQALENNENIQQLINGGITFNDDKTYSTTHEQGTYEGNYTLQGDDLTLSGPINLTIELDQDEPNHLVASINLLEILKNEFPTDFDLVTKLEIDITLKRAV